MSRDEDNAFFKIFNDEMEQWIVPRRKDGNVPKKDEDEKYYPKVEHGLFGLAISGGGIRSATYALGVLQRMARAGIIKFVDVLSTASGGGYIGACWSSLTADAPEFGSNETNFPFQFIDKEGDKDNRQVFDRESDAVRHLRAHGYWLAPHLGIFDVWTWTAFFHYIVTTIANLLVPIPWVLGIMMLTLLIPTEFWNRQEPMTSPIGFYLWLLPAIFFLIFLILTWSQPRLYQVDEETSPSGERARKQTVPLAIKANLKGALRPSEKYGLSSVQQIALIIAIFFSLADLFILAVSGMYHLFGVTGTWVATVGGSGAAFITAAGTIFKFFTKEVQGGVAKNGTEGFGKKALGFAASAIGYVALAILLVVLYVALFKYVSPENNRTLYMIITTVAIALALLMMVIPADWFLNKFSLQSLYRRGMRTAYILKKKHPDNPADNEVVPREKDILLKELKDKIRCKDKSRLVPDMPYHLIVTAVNSGGDKELKKLGRKSDSFIFSNLYSGSRLTGYASTLGKYPDMRLSDAMAISGAALSPNMGQYTTTSNSILLSLFNVRIGSWVQNPKREKAGWLRRGPLINYWRKELFGAASTDDYYVYVSDGGHFDNSAIYELLKRRCKYILAVDAGKGFGNLAAVARLARIDFGVQMDVDTERINLNPETGYSEKPYIVAKLKYPPLYGDDKPYEGVLIWMSTTITKKDKPDVLDYREMDPSFPFNPTGDQFFDQIQFEAYRELGHSAAKTVIDDAKLKKIVATREELASAFDKLYETAAAGQKKSDE